MDCSRAYIQKLLEQNLILVNDEPVKASYKVMNGDFITLLGNLEADEDFTPENIPLHIVYEDEDVLLIDKPSGMVVHPGSGNFHHTLVNALLYYTKNLSDCNGSTRPGIVHRIDKDTSITIDAPIGRDAVNRKKMAVTDVNSKNAVTHVTVLKRYRDYTLVQCELETGRTHQIRVHMSYIGYPIYNDPVYNNQPATPFGQFLHSSEIEFVSPISKKHLHFTSPLPKEFADFLENLE